MTAPRRRTTHATNDLELIEAVVRLAKEPGYVLIGPTGRPFLRDCTRGKGAVVPIARYEQEALYQLLDDGHLTVGGVHHVVYGHREGPANAVLVPRATTAMISRWAALKPLHGGRMELPPPPPPNGPDNAEEPSRLW